MYYNDTPIDYQLTELREFALSYGLVLPTVLTPEKFHRFPGRGKKASNTAAYCIVFSNLLVAVFGDYSSNLDKIVWRATRTKALSIAEQKILHTQIKSAIKKVNAEKLQKEADARSRAAHIYNQSLSAPNDHPYLIKKKVQSYGLKLYKGDLNIALINCSNSLIIPLFDDKGISTLQFINESGIKRFLKGGKKYGSYFVIGELKNNIAIFIVEGYATAYTIHKSTNAPVIIAFDSGNLKPVAINIRAKFPDSKITLCADDDHLKPGNPGITKANEAASEVGGLVAVPNFGSNRPDWAVDFNDLYCLNMQFRDGE